MQRPKQLENLLDCIRECIRMGNYRESCHSVARQNERKISLVDTLHVLTHGYHEKRKTTFDEIFGTWKYAIRGNTIDERTVRVIVAIGEDGMLIITVVHIKEEES